MTNEIYRSLLKGLTKIWLQAEIDKGSDPEKVATTLMDGLVRYVGKCPTKLLSFLEILGEAAEELDAEALGSAVPNVKPDAGAGAYPTRQFNSDNWD